MKLGVPTEGRQREEEGGREKSRVRTEEVVDEAGLAHRVLSHQQHERLRVCAPARPRARARLRARDGGRPARWRQGASEAALVGGCGLAVTAFSASAPPREYTTAAGSAVGSARPLERLKRRGSGPVDAGGVRHAAAACTAAVAATGGGAGGMAEGANTERA